MSQLYIKCETGVTHVLISVTYSYTVDHSYFVTRETYCLSIYYHVSLKQ